MFAADLEICVLTFHLALDLLAVDPRHKRRGIATQLLMSGIAAAENMDMDVFIMGWKMGLPLYIKCGFELVDTIAQDDSMYGGDGEWKSHFLVRKQGSLPALTTTQSGTRIFEYPIG